MKLTRFFRNSSDVSQPNPPRFRVKGSAFFPYKHPASSRLESSALESTTLSREQLQEASEMLFADSKKKPKGDISFDENILNELELKFVKDSVNHPEHGNILGWPALDGDISNRANDLADKVTALESTEVIRYKD